MTERYLGAATVPRDETSLTGPVPAHLPQRLTITLWDFSWYTRAGGGEPYADIDAAMADAASLGYNAVRICAAPLLIAGGLGLNSTIAIEGMGASPAACEQGRVAADLAGHRGSRRGIHKRGTGQGNRNG